jgi:D-alanyl-D-alanine carboxypeptidase
MQLDSLLSWEDFPSLYSWLIYWKKRYWSLFNVAILNEIQRSLPAEFFLHHLKARFRSVAFHHLNYINQKPKVMKCVFNYSKKKFFLVVQIIIAVPIISFSQGFSPETITRFQHVLDSFQNNPANPYIGGMSAAIKVDGLAFFQGAAGYAARNVDGNNNLLPGGTAFETSTLSRMYSVTKTFTASLTLELAKENVFSLDHTVGTYIPFLNAVNPELSGAVTIRQLLAHESGYSNYSDEMMLQIAVAFQPTHEWTPFEALSFVHQISAPGSERRYSNTNYIVLGTIIEIATGKPLQEHFRERFFTPLALNSMYFDAREPQPAGTVLASPHDNISPFNPIFQLTGQPTFPGAYTNISAFPFTAISTLEFASGALITNIADMAEWGNSLFGGRATNPATLDEMLHSISQAPDADGDYLGYGIFRTTRISASDDFIGHDGNAPGYRSVMFYQPDRKMTIAILTNYRGAKLYDVAKALFETLPQFICGNKNKKEDKIMVSFNGNNLCVDREAAARLIERGGYLGSNQFSAITRSTVNSARIENQKLLSENELELNIFPNPADNKVAISFKPRRTSKIEVSIYDFNGKLISVIRNGLMEKGMLFKTEMETSRIPAGIYFAEIKSANNILRKKFVINR